MPDSIPSPNSGPLPDGSAPSSPARSKVLASIRMALGQAAPAAAIAAEYAAIPRGYNRSGSRSGEDLIEFFCGRLHEYDAGVYRAERSAIPATIGAILAKRGLRAIAVPDGIPPDWLPEGFDFQAAERFDKFALDKLEGVLCGCTVAIAETGSIVLQNAPAQGPRILSLVPDYHLCVVLASQIVATVPEAFDRLEATSALPTTFISGPSATADIEMTRIKGVHGPRFLDVLIVMS